MNLQNLFSIFSTRQNNREPEKFFRRKELIGCGIVSAVLVSTLFGISVGMNMHSYLTENQWSSFAYYPLMILGELVAIALATGVTYCSASLIRAMSLGRFIYDIFQKPSELWADQDKLLR